MTAGTPSSRWATLENRIKNECWIVGLLGSRTWGYAFSAFVEVGLLQVFRTHSILALLTQTHTAPGGSPY